MLGRVAIHSCVAIPLSRKKLSRKYRSIFVSKVGPATGVTPVAGLIFETKNQEIFLERFFWREITAREQVSRAVILEKI